MRNMFRNTVGVLLGVVAPLVKATPCPVHGVEDSTKRVVYIYAQPGRTPTVAAEWSETISQEHKTVEAACLAARVEDRAQCILCLAIAAVKAIRDGDVEDLVSMSPSSMAKHVRDLPWRDANGRAIPYPDEYVSMYPWIRFVNDRTMIGIMRKLRNGKVWPVTVLYAERDSATERWVLTNGVSSAQFPLAPLSLSPQKLKPVGMTVFRVGQTKGAFDIPHLYPADPHRDHAAHRDALLYLRPERLPYADAPFLSVDRAALDPAAAQLRDALEAQMRWLHDADYPYAELEKHFAQYSHDTLRQRVMPRIVAKGDQRWSTGRGSFVTAVGIDTTLLLATLRVAARVQLEDGFVWYCWAPRGVDRGPDGAALITLHQVRLPDGTWRMLANPNDHGTHEQFDLDAPKRRYARKLISRDIDVCGAITQPDRERFFASVKRDDD